MGHEATAARRAVDADRARVRAEVRTDVKGRRRDRLDDLHDLPTEELTGRLAGSRRAENLVAYERLRVVAAIWTRWWPDEELRRADRRSGRRHTSAESLHEACVVTEVAGALGISETAASHRVDAAVALLVDRRLPVAADLCGSGTLDWARLHALVSRTRDLTTEQAQQVEARVLVPKVRELTIGRFMTAVDRAVLAVDPAAAEKRRKAAADGRRVTFWKDREGIDAADGTGSLCASGPAAPLTAAMAVLDATARRLRDEGDPRTLDQLRHDLLVHACTHGRLPLPHDVVRACLPAGSDASDGPRACDVSAGCVDAEAAGSTTASTVVVPRPTVPAHILVTVSLQTLLGLNDEPGDLAGYGPITAELARDLAAEGIWRCAAVDDVHGTVLGVGRTTWTPGYVPGKALRDFLAVAARTCAVPWCEAVASRCDVDHHTPYAAGGSTCSCNTGPLCRRHHREKSAGYLTVLPSADPEHPAGTSVWTTRGGRRFVVVPDVPLPAEAYATASASAPTEPTLRAPGEGGAGRPADVAPPF